uniref:ARAD1B16148p n=1 Tax=Blastobotrys adeninivorans TaxID=409370 RepID=A0A060T6Z9_BLAAD
MRETVARGFYSFYDRPFTFQALKSRIKSSLRNNNVPTSVYVEAISACKALARTAKRSNGQGRLDELMVNESVHKDPASPMIQLATSVVDRHQHHGPRDVHDKVLRHYLASVPQPPTYYALTVLGKRASLTSVSIALRTAVLKKDIDGAFAVLDTADLVLSRAKVIGSIYGLGAIVSAQIAYGILVDVPLTFFMLGMCSATLASIYQSMTRTPRVRWAKTKPFMHRLINYHNLVLTNRIVTGFDELIDTNVTNFHRSPSKRASAQVTKLQQHLRQRGMRLIDGPENEMYRQYWLVAGEGYKWVEPDQDPVDPWITNARQR